MFYCETCREQKGWPQSVMRWRSMCEVCDEFSADCNDIPSCALPDPVSDAAADSEGAK